ncbi:MAG: GDP-mannose 4,6-dehydratase, partial [Nitrosopumilaceae archaeon]|nr:GDP-mannose 4,6-dehydratase [Nitrosopumilaceae archaeon]
YSFGKDGCRYARMCCGFFCKPYGHHYTDGIFHLAALGFVPESWNDPDLYRSVNVGGTRNVFRIAGRHHIKVVYASSSSVYGNAQSIPIVEND